jgi:pSer/pThr/pTyr-binding forkhead associated (FHA) protein
MSIYRLKGASGAVANQSFTLAERNVIGSAEDCDLRVNDPGISSRHAEIIMDDAGQLLLQNLDSTSETQVNGEPVERCSLASGDEIRIGTNRWVLQAPGLRPDRVLTAEAVARRRSYLPWLIVGGLLAAAALAWRQGWLPF